LKSLFNNILSILIKGEKQEFVWLMVFSLLISIADILSLAFLFFIVNFYTPHSAPLNIPLLSEWRIDEHSILPALLLLIVFITKSFAGYYFYKSQYRFVYRVASRISGKNLLLYLEGSYNDYVNTHSSVLIRRILHHPVQFAQYILAGIQQIITEVILIIITLIVLLWIDARLIAILAVVLFPAIIILRHVTKKRLSTIRANIKTAGEQSFQYLNEGLSAYVESNIYNRNDFFADRYQTYQRVLDRYLADLQIAQGMPSRFFEAFSVLGLFVLIIVSELTGITTIVSLYTLGAFAAAAYKIIPGISKIINLSSHVKTYNYTVNELTKELNREYLAKQVFNNESLSSIEFKNVCYSYRENVVLSGINFIISKSKFTGISGNSGKGKTTLINLLLGFLSPDEGDILFNSKCLNEIERKAFWNKISYVKQAPFIVHESILKNITLFDEDYNEEKLKCSINATGLNPFIEQFADGIEQVITEGAKNISGGQQQRIAIARAIYKEADVIILDEPFNELDEQSELSMLRHFKKLSESGKMIILITHNTNSLSFCDAVIEL
jgi:ABC-type multidrug transport system fused ATPase/permease subunit